MTTPYFKTDIAVLDKMLGIDKKVEAEINNDLAKINNDRIVLIKGGPGSGKTTLGLQILNNHLKRNGIEGSTTFIAGYVSLEIDPDLSIEYASKSFQFDKLNEKSPNFYYKSNEKLRDSIKEFYNPKESHPPKLSDVIYKCLEIKQTPENKEAFKIIFFDSLNILIDIIHSVVDKNMNEREVIKSICEIDRGKDKNKRGKDKNDNENTIFLFSVEYHPILGQSKMAISESFMCDTEILLSVEAIFAAREKTIPNISSIGYKIEGDLDGKKVNEYRTFCRVLKTRFDNHQTRRCSYDIVNGEGIKFYETFPGDGQISLFHENSQQKEAWESFFIEDIPHQFPALRRETFDRKQMQQNFSSRRRFMKVPEKTDLYLSSYDNYWIHWFTTVEQKSIIRDFIQVESKTFKNYIDDCEKSGKYDEKSKLEPIINQIHKIFLDSIFDKKDIENLYKENKKKNFKISSKQNLNGKYFSLNVFDDMLYLIVNEDLSKKDIDIEIKNTCIKDVTAILFTTSLHGRIERKVIQFNRKYFASIIRNRQGTIILLSDGTNETLKFEKILFANSVHQKIEFRTSDVDKDCYLLFDSRYNTTYKSRRNYDKVDWLNDSDKYNLFVIKDNDIKENIEDLNCVSNLSKKVCLNEILLQFLTEKIEEEIQSILNVFCTEQGLKCIACNCLVNLYSTYHESKNIFKELKCKRNNNDCPSKISEDKNSIDINNYKKCLWATKEGLQKLSLSISSEKIIDLIAKTILPKLLSKDRLNKFLKEIINKAKKPGFETLKSFIDKKRDEGIIENEFISDIGELYLKLLLRAEKKSFLASIDGKNKLKIFGERKSEFIKELTNWDYKNSRPIHFRQSLFGLYDSDSYLSIPYNANVGIFVYRKDILNDFYKVLKDNPRSLEDYIWLVKKIYIDQMSSLNRMNSLNMNDLISGPQSRKIDEIIYHSIIDLYPKTWEEIFAIYKFYHDRNDKKELVFDVQTQDTYYCTFLELLWNCGGSFNVLADYTIDKSKETKVHLLHANSLLAYMYYSGILPENSSIQPEAFSNRYNVLYSDKEKPRDWIFGRFWYSTFIELFNAKKQDSTELYLWNPLAKNELGLMPIPVTLNKYLVQTNANEVEHCTAWGDWHLGIIQGSENIKLGKDIINHLMSSRKIIENANNNAILPTTEEFYTLFKNTNCFNPSQRGNISMPNTTYKEIRYKYFRHAQSRSQIYDYRHCMVELNTIIKYIENVAIRDKNTTDLMPYALPVYLVHEIEHLLGHALKGINDLINLDNN
jgi:hypothetical protein